MKLKFLISNPTPFTIFAPLALSVLVLIFTLYLTTRQTVNVQTALSANAPASSPESAPAMEREPAAFRESVEGSSFTSADYARHVAALRQRLAGQKFTIIIQAPFVVIGDGTPAAVRSQSETVRWAVRKLKDAYFEKDPAEILDIWLFKDKASYRKHTRELFGDEPDTPYGYYSSAHKALIMNIETGGGTLVHEIVHPFIEANFPGCPAWLNEGLGSLYEQSGEVDGHIHGYTNWRLPGLQDAIRAGIVPSFKSLMTTDTRAFYNGDKGTNYGQARYLCYYLQERGLLIKFYKEFYAHRQTDPTGYQTLQEILNEPDMNAFQKKWEKFVLTLQEEFSLKVIP